MVEEIRKLIERATVEHCQGGDLWLTSQLAAEGIGKLIAAQAAPAVPDEWRTFVEDCSKTAGGMVNGNNLSRLAGRLLAAAPSAQPQEAGQACETLRHQFEAAQDAKPVTIAALAAPPV